MARVTWTPAAEKNLDDIFDYIGIQNHSANAAEKVIREIEAKSHLYSQQPEMGTLRKDLAPDVRCFTVANYVVIYRPFGEGIQVLLVIHGARDIPALFHGTSLPFDD